jgi:L-galactonate dehydratase
MSLEKFVRCIDFLYITNPITPEAVAILKATHEERAERMREAELSQAVPAYTIIAGWLGYDNDKMEALLEEILDRGYIYFKLKIGSSVEEDVRRLTIARKIIGHDGGNVLMVDANQVSIKLETTAIVNKI